VGDGRENVLGCEGRGLRTTDSSLLTAFVAILHILRYSMAFLLYFPDTLNWPNTKFATWT
jgi:hypothetical protein